MINAFKLNVDFPDEAKFDLGLANFKIKVTPKTNQYLIF